MSDYTNLQNDSEILRLAEQERCKAIGAFVRWLFIKRHNTASANLTDAVAAE